MADNNNSEEIDLGQLFHLIGNGLKNIFNSFLRVFLYLKKNIFILGGLIIIGLALGYGLNKISSKQLKTEVIVRPNLESKNYLYDVVDEIQANIKAKDTTFFKSIGIENIDFRGLKVQISRVEGSSNSENDTKYLELLQSFENTEAISDILRAELQNKSSFNHRVTFCYEDSAFGQSFAKAIIDYLNTNEYFEGLTAIYKTNAESRIEENKILLKQVDNLIANYSKKMVQEDELSGNQRIVLDNQEKLNITGLFNLKNDLIKDIEAKNIELQKQTDPIKVINFGKTQVVQKSVFGQSLVLVPLVLLGIFFLISTIKYLNTKAAEINQ
ncbi:hypothetical protein [uncultured Croceitalea sp.]|uniref:hypothetical protein n=1 Tax=uncultured Croceitalea sp. TaxID=1798908 RepID=UPI00374E2B0D